MLCVRLTDLIRMTCNDEQLRNNTSLLEESKLYIKITNTLSSKAFEKRTKEILQEISSENILFL